MPVTMERSSLERLNEVKMILRSLLIAVSSREVTLKQLNSLYYDTEEENIPFREFNYASLVDFLHSMPDTVRLQYNIHKEMCVYHVNTEKSAHISSLVARQKKPTKRTKSSYNCKPRSAYHYSSTRSTQNYQPVSSITVSQVLQEMKNSPMRSSTNCGIRKVDILSRIKKHVGRCDTYTIQSLNKSLYELSHLIVVDTDYVYFKDELAKSNRSETSFNSVGQKSNFSNINNPVSLVKNKSTYEVTTTSIPKVKINSTSNIQTKCVTEIKPKDNPVSNVIPVITNSSNNKEEKIQPTKTNLSSDVIKERTKIRLQKLIDNHPEGIWCSELPNVYKNEYNVELEYIELGFHSITEFVATLPDIFSIVEPPNTNRQMVLSAKEPDNDTKKYRSSKTLAALYNFEDYVVGDPEPVPIQLSSEVCQTLIPDGVMNLNETVDQISVTTLKGDEYIEVNISEIFTPTFFWVTLRKNKKKIKMLMNDLDEFYRSQDLDAYRIPQVVLEPGLNIACIYSKIWHRAIIKKIKPDGFVVVLFYDYGTVKTYNPNNIYFLHKKFSALPAQAIACGLFNIRPIGGHHEWSSESTNKFINKVWDIPMIAIISTTDEDNNTMMITLTDTSDDTTDLHINDWMVERQLAEWGKMVNKVPIHNMCLFDETSLLKIREGEYEAQLYSANENINNKNIENRIYVDNRDSLVTSPNLSYNCTDSFYDAPNVTRLLKESMTLTKQTNTIAQAILLNMPINKSDAVNINDVNSKKKELDTKAQENPNAKLPYSSKKLSADLNSNLSTIKVNISEMNNNYFGSEFVHSDPVYLKQNTRSNCDSQSSRRSSFSQISSFDKSAQYVSQNEFASKQHPNEYSETRSTTQSTQSTQSYRSTFDFQPLVENNNRGLHLNVNEYDRFSVQDGTPTFELISNGLPKSNSIHIKYPSKFATLMDVKEKNSNNYTHIDTTHNQNGNSNECDELDEGYYTRPCTSHTQSNSSESTSRAALINSSMYTVVYLSEKCENKAIHVFHLDEEGWVCVNEVVDAFTNLKHQRVLLKLLEILDYRVNFKYLTRDAEAQLFADLDISKMKLPRNEDKKIVLSYVLVLMPLKAMLPVLVRLDFLNSKVLKEAAPLMKQCNENIEGVLYEKYNNKILYDVLNLLVEYKKFKQSYKKLNI